MEESNPKFAGQSRFLYFFNIFIKKKIIKVEIKDSDCVERVENMQHIDIRMCEKNVSPFPVLLIHKL